MSDASKTEKQLLAEARSMALSDLRKKYQSEYNTLVQKHAGARGIAWAPRPSKADRAREQIEKLIAENPELESLYRAELKPAQD